MTSAVNNLDNIMAQVLANDNIDLDNGLLPTFQVRDITWMSEYFVHLTK